MSQTPMRGQPQGFALMAALWLVVLVGATGYELSVRSRTRRLAVANALETVQANAAAEAGLETVRGALEQRLLQPLNTRVRGIVAAPIDPLGDLTFLRADTLHLGDERSHAIAYDAGARLQINRATEDDVRRFLIAVPLDASVADGVAQCILDWRDPDTLRRARGAERADYLRAGARVLPADGDFRHVEELRDVSGVTPELYTRIAPYVSVLGSGQINLNSAPRLVLRSLPGLGDEAVDVIIRAQQSERPIRSLEELTPRLSSGARASLLNATPELMSRVAFDTREVIVEADGWMSGSPVRTHAVAVYERNGDALSTTWRRVGR